jgi:hypothetical protein
MDPCGKSRLAEPPICAPASVCRDAASVTPNMHYVRPGRGDLRPPHCAAVCAIGSSLTLADAGTVASSAGAGQIAQGAGSPLNGTGALLRRGQLPNGTAQPRYGLFRYPMTTYWLTG